MDCIKITGLKVYAYHGVFEQEQEEGQDFFFNIWLYTETRQAGIQDELTLSTNYGEVCEKVTEWVTEEKKQLIESVAEKVATNLLLTFPLIQEVKVEVEKPHAPIGLPFENVSVEITRGWHTAYLSIGSNIGDSKKFLSDAVAQLKEHHLMKNIRVSEFLVTKPYGGVEQDDFLNGAVELRTILAPEELLQELHVIEQKAHRTREIHWGPRTLDMDIVFYDGMVYESEDLVIPHVDMENRFFVLQPLSELCPNKRHPLLGRTVNQLLKALEEKENG